MANQEAIRKWYIALKSGEYKQGKDRLRTGDTYCCWGVACEISGTGRWKNSKDLYSFSGVLALPPREVYEWLGVDLNESGTPRLLAIPPDRVEETVDLLETSNRKIDLALLNDRGGSFDLIADIIWYNYGEGDPPEVPGE